MNWHNGCRKADINIIELSSGQRTPYCFSCGEIAPSESNTVARPTDNEWNIPREPHPRKRNLYWPNSVQYIDENPPEYGKTFIECPNSAQNQQVKELNLVDGVRENQKHLTFEKLTGRQIRLLKLSKGELGDPLHIQLKVQSFQAGLEYEALSYTWATDTGKRDATHTIYHGDSWDIIKVTENCANALRRLRYPTRSRTLWVDAICINQEDVAERSHQVDMMADIYACAKQVVIYLGDQEPTGTPRKQIAKLRERPYFSRIWVVQEVAFARAKSVVCGSKFWDWDEFYSASWGPDWLEHVCRHKFRELREEPEFLNLLYSTNRCNSSDKRDRIFALLGFVPGFRGLGLIPDYTLCFSHVMIGTAAHVLTENFGTQAHRLLLEAAHKNIERGPSWVPDWTSDELRTFNRFSPWGGLHNRWGKLSFLNTSNLDDSEKCHQLAFSKQTGSLKTRGFCVATGPTLRTMTASSGFPISFNGKLRVYGREPRRGHSLFYVPKFGALILLALQSATESHVVGRLDGICTEDIASMPYSAKIGIKPPTSGTIFSQMIKTAKWVRIFLQSGDFREIDLTSLVQPWDKLIDTWQDIPRKHTTDKKQQLRMLLRKAIIYYQLSALDQLSKTKLLGTGKHKSAMQATCACIRNVRSFLRDGAILKSTSQTLRQILLFVGLLQNLKRAGRIQNHVGIPSWLVAEGKQPPAWAGRFHPFLRDYLARPSIKVYEENMIYQLSSFLLAFVVSEQADRSWTSWEDHADDKLTPFYDLHGEISLSEKKLLSEMVSKKILPGSLDHHTTQLLVKGNGIMDSARKREELWSEAEDCYRLCNNNEIHWNIYYAMSSMNWVLYQELDVIDGKYVDLYIT